MRKFILKIGVFCFLSLVLSGCFARTEEDVRILTDNFLEAYFNVDYKKAASMCTDSLSREFLRYEEEIGVLSESVIKEVINEASKVQVIIAEVRQVEEDKSTMVVIYTIVFPGGVKEVRKSLVVKKVNDLWKIASL